MPYSSDEGKPVIARWLQEISPATVLDIGPGAGAYARLVRAKVPAATVDCVEIFDPYVSTFDLPHLYDRVVVGDIRDPDVMTLLRDSYDVVIMGDVLEHMSASDAERVWCNMLALSTRACIVSIPVVPYPQGPSHGNEHEAHVSEWDAGTVLRRLPEIGEYWIGQEIGVFIAHTRGRQQFPLPVGVWQ
jgi:hypothetical protein